MTAQDTTKTPLAPQSAQAAADRPICYMPLGEQTEIELTVDVVRKFLARPTKKGNMPEIADIVKFMMLCKARELNPWVGDAFLVGYDTNDGPEFNLLTSHQALLKRAERNKQYDGMESGVVVKVGEKIERRDGSLTYDGDVLIGGWARTFRKDRAKPTFKTLKLSAYDAHRARWKTDPAGMIVKCAEAAALRADFPTQLGGLYTHEEQDAIEGRTEAAASLPPVGRHEIFADPATPGGDQSVTAVVEPTAESEAVGDKIEELRQRAATAEAQAGPDAQPIIHTPATEEPAQPEPVQQATAPDDAALDPQNVGDSADEPLTSAEENRNLLEQHACEKLRCDPAEAAQVVARWLKRGRWSDKALGDEERWEKIIWPKFQKADLDPYLEKVREDN
jgi:phage recombination protein Bet